MKNTIIYLSALLLLFIFLSCSSPTATAENSISVEVLAGRLKITNNSNMTMYLFVVEQRTAASINWAPHFSDLKVIKNSSILIDYSEIYNGSADPVKAGDAVIVNYWDDSDKTKPEIYSKVVVL